jgi:hypothetical protein
LRRGKARRDGDLTRRATTPCGQRLIDPLLGIPETVERRAGPLKVWGELAHVTDELDDVGGAGDQVGTVAQQRVTSD